MVNIRIKNSLLREALAEVLGTFLLVYIGNAAIASSLLSNNTQGTFFSINWGYGIGLMMGAYAAGGVSGAHLNPAVTVAQAVVKKFSWKKVPVYILAQFVGAFLSAVVLFFLYYDALYDHGNGKLLTSGPNATAGVFATYPQSYLSVWNAIYDQFLGTAMLLLCINGITDEKNMNLPKPLVPYVLGFLLVGIGIAFGYNCGYAINPARDLAPRIFTAMAGWGSEPFSYNNYNWFWIPTVIPFFGAIFGSVLYSVLIEMHIPPKEEEPKRLSELAYSTTRPPTGARVSPVSFTPFTAETAEKP